MVTIIDIGMGNLRSIEKRLNNIDVECQITSNKNKILNASKLILPGVGHFKSAMHNLQQAGLIETLNETVLEKKTPILGICLGMQIMANYSEEGNCKGLGWFDARVVKFTVKDSLLFKIPHMGWNTAIHKKESQLLKGIKEDNSFYFVHSYHIICHDKNDILATTRYSYDFTSIIEKQNIIGTQFHPEKSHDWGGKLLTNFAMI